MDLSIFPPDDLLQARIKLPLSKSICNRALIINALTAGALPIKQLADCDDTRVLLDALNVTEGTIDVGAAGTAMRFLTAFFSVLPGADVILDGTDRMRKRPVGPLVEALRQCGANISYLGEEGFPPVAVKGSALTGGEISIRADVSSQFVSAILMIAPLMEKGLTLNLEGDRISAPYVHMTLEMMKRWGVESHVSPERIIVPKSSYRPVEFTVEADWSAASYWYEIEALTSGWVTLDGLDRFSLQGDSRLVRLFENLGVNTEFDGEEGGIDLVASPDTVPRMIADLTDTPDLTQTLVVSCAMLGIPFRFTGVASLRIKETDRIEALRRELLRVGIVLTVENDDTVSWEDMRCPVKELPVFDTYRDHRMALAFAPVSLFIPGIIIRNAEVVSKSYPAFWDDLRAAGFTIKIVESDSPIPNSDDNP